LCAAGHDLRTPCYSIQSSTALLARVPAVAADAEAVSLLKHMSASCCVLDSIISNVLQMRQLQLGAPLDMPQSVSDPHALLRTVADELSSLCANRAVAAPLYEELAHAPLPALLQGAASHLGACLRNMLFTAVRFASWCAPASAAVCMRAEAEPLPPEGSGLAALRVSVTAPGRPLSDEECDALFVPFGLAPSDKGGGTGLGLYVARSFARAMGGDVTLARGLAEGVRATLCVPLRVAARADDPMGPPPPPLGPPHVANSISSPPPSPSSPRARPVPNIPEVELTARMFGFLVQHSDDTCAPRCCVPGLCVRAQFTSSRRIHARGAASPSAPSARLRIQA
jgi:hypothetical protein